MTTSERRTSGSCPTCKAPSAPKERESPFPFCSARCRAVDLGHWLDERYRLEELGADSPQLGDDLLED